MMLQEVLRGFPITSHQMSISSYQIIFEKKQRGINWPNIQNFLSKNRQLCKKGTALI